MKIAILGAGRMGRWLCGVLASQHDVGVYDPEAQRTRDLAGVTVIDEPAALRTFSPRLLINCATLSDTIEAFSSALPHLPAECILCDIASVKTGLEAWYRACGFKFVSLHPMFGPTFADLERLSGQSLIIIRGAEPAAQEFFSALFSELGVKIFEYTFDEHDRMMAYSLTIPFISSLVFAACVETTTVPGTTFARHRATSQGLLAEDDQLLAEILFNPHSLRQLDRISAKLGYLRHIIADRDFAELSCFLADVRTNVEGIMPPLCGRRFSFQA